MKRYFNMLWRCFFELPTPVVPPTKISLSDKLIESLADRHIFYIDIGSIPEGEEGYEVLEDIIKRLKNSNSVSSNCGSQGYVNAVGHHI